MKPFDWIMSAVCVALVLTFLVSFVNYNISVTNQIEKCKTDGGNWVKIPSITDNVPGGVPVFKCNKANYVK